ncbi:MAG: molybdopterin-binding protein [Pseudomonadota bacterium]
MRFETIIVADWSSAATPSPAKPSKDAIWTCTDREGDQQVEYHRTRHDALAHIDALLAEGRRTLLGFDFAMGYPPGLAEGVTGRADALAIWDWLAAHIEDAPDNGNNRFAVAELMNRAFPGRGPFWGRPRSHDHPDLPERGSDRNGHGIADHRLVESFAPSAQSALKLYTTGSVGGQSLVGMAALAKLRLRHPDMAVWPQQTGFAVPEACLVLAEIYPSLWPPAPHGIKDAGQVIATARALRALPETAFTAPAPLEDSARVAREEGWILGVLPPSSCFALPPGAEWTKVSDALAALRAATLRVTGAETVPISDAAGRILAGDLVARRDNPPMANAAVDGWGFAHATLTPGPIPVAAGRSAAGVPHGGAVPAGHALRILTGAEIPEGVDTVALQEDATEHDGYLRLSAIPKRGANTRRAGEDVTRGGPLLPQGRILRPTDLALAVTGGHGTVPVRTRLRVGVLSTGDELTASGSLDGIPDANRPMLLAMLAGWGLDPIDLGHVGDTEAALTGVLDGAEVDAILTSGGASDGAEDHLSRLMRARGDVQHWRIALKPGRPLMLGRWAGTPLFGLPGNPVAAFTCAALFARPALLQMAGAGWREPEATLVPAAFSKQKKAGRSEVLRARLRDGRAEIFRSEGSGLVTGLSWADGFVELPHGEMRIEPGTEVRYIPFAALGLA